MLISPTIFAVILFIVFLLLVALVILAVLIRDMLEKQKVYSNFADYLGDFLIVVSKDGRLLDASPKYVSDALYDQILQNKSFKPILSNTDYERLQKYIEGLDAYPDIPFVFSFDSETRTNWYELRAYMQKQSGDMNMVLLIKNVTREMETSRQRDQLRDNVDLLLRSTGDFLWSLDVDSRQFTFLTPLIDDEGRVVPRSLGVQDIRALMPEDDYAFFEKHINTRIVDFRASGQDMSDNRGIRLRLSFEEGKQVWFAFSGRLCTEENAKIIFKGSARRMDMVLENPILEDINMKESTISSVLSFPDIRVFWIDRNYKIRGCNQAFSLAFGMSIPDEVEGKRLLEVVRPKYFSLFHGVLSEVFERGLAKSWKGPFGVGKRLLWFNAVPLKGTDGYTQRVLGVYMQLDENDFENVNKSTLEVL